MKASSEPPFAFRRRLTCFALIVACVAVHGAALAAKTDVLYLRNGDRITGEVKKLEYGMLRYKTDDFSTVEIKWSAVQTLTSIHGMQVELEDGTRHFGALAEPSAFRKLRVIGLLEFIELDMDEVVKIEPIKEKFIERLDGDLSLGFSFDKGSDVTRLNFNGSTTYRTRKRAMSLTLDSLVTSQSDKPNSERSDLSFSYNRFYKKKWFGRGDAGLNRNDELGIKKRISVGLGAGREMIQTNRQALRISGLMTGNQETVEDGSSTNNLELAFDFEHRVFKRNTPKTELRTNLTVLPSLSDWGRVRADFSTNLRQEIIKDFFWSLSGYYSYDNKSPTEQEITTDYGVVTSFGWTF